MEQPWQLDDNMGTHPRSSSASDAGSSTPSRAGTPDPEDIIAYQELMSTLIPPSSLPPPPLPVTAAPGGGEGDEDEETEEGGVKRSMTKAEKQNAKKKRRKERERLAREAEAEAAARAMEKEEQEQDTSHLVEFRLFSSCPVKSVSLLPPSEDYPITSNPRHAPWTEAHSERVRRVAAEAAVDAPDLGGPSTYHQKWTRLGQPIRALEATATDGHHPTPDLFIGVVPRPRRPSSHPSIRAANHTVAPTPASKKGKNAAPVIPTIPLAPIVPSPAPSPPAKRSRRGRRRSPSHAPPRFWAPPPGLGGKARGYAWGYRDSMEGRREEGKWGGYLRSK